MRGVVRDKAKPGSSSTSSLFLCLVLICGRVENPALHWYVGIQEVRLRKAFSVALE